LMLGLFGANKVLEPPKAIEVSLVTESAPAAEAQEMEQTSAASSGSEEDGAAPAEAPSAPEAMEIAEPEPEPVITPKPVEKPVERPLQKTVTPKAVQSSAKVPVKTPPKKTPPAQNKTAAKTNKTPIKTCDFDCQMRKITVGGKSGGASGGKTGLGNGSGGKNPDGKTGKSGGANGATGTGGSGGKTTAQIKSAINFSIAGAAKREWDRCKIVSGPDVNQLRTKVVFTLTNGGGLAGFSSLSTSGQTPSNRAQVSRFEDCARMAIRAAAPFSNLPQDNYGLWSTYTLTFDKAH
jgi:periplasmic protein TonB